MRRWNHLRLHERDGDVAVRHALHRRCAHECIECELRNEQCFALLSFVRFVTLLGKELLPADVLERQLRRRSGRRRIEVWICDGELRDRASTGTNSDADTHSTCKHSRTHSTDVREQNTVGLACGNKGRKPS